MKKVIALLIVIVAIMCIGIVYYFGSAQRTNLDFELVRAVRYNDISKVKDFLRQGANVNVETKSESYYKYTPLHYAAYDVNVDIVRVLIEAGGNVNAVDYEGNTPLDVAIGLDRDDSIIKMLTSCGAKR